MESVEVDRLWGGDFVVVAALDSFSDPKLWTPEEQEQPSMYLHRLIVRRKYSGLGTDVIEWACKRAGELGNNWVRIDVWTDNVGLHRYYEQRGFVHVRTLDLSDYPSGALFKRKATDRHQAQPDTAITERPQDLPTRSQPDTSAHRMRITLVPSIA